MTIQCCGSCGQPFLAGTEPWLVVDPGRPVPADWICTECERTFEINSRVFVFTDPRRHVTTLLSDRGLRAARHDALRPPAP